MKYESERQSKMAADSNLVLSPRQHALGSKLIHGVSSTHAGSLVTEPYTRSTIRILVCIGVEKNIEIEISFFFESSDIFLQILS